VLDTLLASARAAVSTRPATSDARVAAERAAAPLRETLAAQGTELELLCERPARVAVEADVVERILSPLLENAARYARHQITLDIRPVDREVLFEIRDDGPGVHPSDRERIFDPGFRGPGAHPDTHGGAGLGLPLVRRLTRAAGGEVEARASDDGASFAVRLPSAEVRHPRSQREGIAGR
jgi:signal transduction histidine kinase